MDIKTVTYQCPNCAAALEFDESAGNFRCYYCDSTFTEEQIKSIFAGNEGMSLDENEPQLNAQQLQDEEFSGQSALYSCPNCGAGVICDSLTASTRCHFCHTPVILTGRLSGEYKPDMIIPFATTREHAEKSFREYIKGKLLLPRGFKDDAQISNISALYVPYWLKSGVACAAITGEGQIETRYRSGGSTYIKTKVYHVERGGEMIFIRVPCDGSKRIDDSLMEAIEPFNYSGLKPFSMSYLSGKAAEKYDVTREEAAVRIDERIKQAAAEMLKSAAPEYTKITVQQTTLGYRQPTYVYALLPVWFLNYSYKGKDYAFVMNGQTGAMFGELPISRLKRFLIGLGVFAIVELVALFFGGGFFA